ncbi:MAG: phosphoribosylaminoimidazolesuccinocarboxamide synthase [Thermostichales cyanobacterium BF3_bins_165]
MELVYEGKAKRLYRTGDPQLYLCEYKDDATAFNAQKRGSIAHKGEINCRIAAIIFSYLQQQGIPTHFVRQVAANQMEVQALTIIPIEVVMRNRAAGSLCKRLGLPRGLPIQPPLLEFYYKNDDLGDPLVTRDHIDLLKLATPEQVEELASFARRINELLQDFYRRCDLELIDFKLEFGRDPWGQIVLADEISPDTCRLWDLRGGLGRVLDKDLFRFDLGDAAAGYQEVLQRIEGLDSSQ